jgi:hypothetical protein
MQSRKRTRVNYKEISSDHSDYNYIETLEDIPSDVSGWEASHREALRIYIQNTESIELDTNIDEQFQSLELKDWDKSKINNASSEVLNKIDKSVASLITKIKYIVNLSEGPAKKEVRVDGFVMKLLNILGFDNYPCIMYPQYEYSAILKNKKITSKVEFIVINNKKYIVLIVEDKHSGNTGYLNDWSENQIAGEIFGCAYHTLQLMEQNYEMIEFPIKICAIRIIGTMFTFYNSEISKAYMEECYSRLPIKNKIIVYRYPPVYGDDENVMKPITALDFCDSKDRLVILQILKFILNKTISQ